MPKEHEAFPSNDPLCASALIATGMQSSDSQQLERQQHDSFGSDVDGAV
jgi:hypothetical protein